MLKLIGCLLILGGTTIGGILYGDTYRKRLIQLKELERAILQLQNEISYIYTTLPEAFLKIANKSKEPIKCIFERVSELLLTNKVDSVYEGLSKAIEANIDKLSLNHEDIDIFLDLSKNLGESDVESQHSIFNLAISNMKKQINEAEILKSKNLKMYRYLGFSLGAMLVILLI